MRRPEVSQARVARGSIETDYLHLRPRFRRFVMPFVLVSLLVIGGMYAAAFVTVRDEFRTQIRETLENRAAMFREQFRAGLDQSVSGIALMVSSSVGDLSDRRAVRDVLIDASAVFTEVVNIAVTQDGETLSVFPLARLPGASWGDDPRPRGDQGQWTSPAGRMTTYGYPRRGDSGPDVFMTAFTSVSLGDGSFAELRVDFNVTAVLYRAFVGGQDFAELGGARVDLSIVDLGGNLIETTKNLARSQFPVPMPAAAAQGAFAEREWIEVADYILRLRFRADIDARLVTATAFGAASGVLVLGVLTVVLLLAFGAVARRQIVRADLLTLEAVEARYEAIQARLNPHFVFNSLNHVVGLVEEGDTATALRSLSELSVILHQLIRSKAAFASLSEELTLVRSYVGLQVMHRDEPLRLAEEIETGALNLLVPRMCLQPLVENVFVHATGLLNGARTVTIRAHEHDAVLIIEIEDDGPGVSSHAVEALNASLATTVEAPSEHIGLASVHRRIVLVHGEGYGVTIMPSTRGFHVRLSLPCREP